MNIVLVCSAGMSTSLLVTKMESAAQQKGMNAVIKALPEAEISRAIDSEQIDVILLGPQVRYLQAKIKELASHKNIPVDLIQPMHYGMMDGNAVLEQAIKLARS
jgi:cellobiose PTS system EIIB component